MNPRLKATLSGAGFVALLVAGWFAHQANEAHDAEVAAQAAQPEQAVADWPSGPPVPPPLKEMIETPIGPMIVDGGDDIGLARSKAVLAAFFEACPGLSELREVTDASSAAYWEIGAWKAAEDLGWHDAVTVEVRARDVDAWPASVRARLPIQVGDLLMYKLGGGAHPGILANGTTEQAVCGWPTNIERVHGDFFTPLEALSLLEGRVD